MAPIGKKSGMGSVFDCNEFAYFEPIGSTATRQVTVAAAQSETTAAHAKEELSVCISDTMEFPSLAFFVQQAPSLSAKARARQSASLPPCKQAEIPPPPTESPPLAPPQQEQEEEEEEPPSLPATSSTSGAVDREEKLCLAAPVVLVRNTFTEFSAQRPRNTFAKLPKKVASEVQTPAVMIDWCAEGAASFLQASYKLCKNPAHLGPHDVHKPSDQMSLSALKAQPKVDQCFSKVQNKAYPTKPRLARPVVTQPRGR